MKPLLLAAATFGLCQCSLRTPGRADGIDPNPFALLEKQATATNHDAGRIAVPMLRSAALERRWGSPKLLVGPKGGYALRYENPADESNHLTIFGSPDRFPTAGRVPPPYTDLGPNQGTNQIVPTEIRQQWRHLQVAGRDVRYYINEGALGDEPVQFSTETFRLTAPDGRTASYRLRSASRDSQPAAAVEKLFRSAAF